MATSPPSAITGKAFGVHDRECPSAGGYLLGTISAQDKAQRQHKRCDQDYSKAAQTDTLQILLRPGGPCRFLLYFSILDHTLRHADLNPLTTY
jgi:hypothetical protein